MSENRIMADDAHEAQEPRIFTLKSAERARRELEPTLAEAVECKHKLTELDEELADVAQRILMMGGITLPHESLGRVRIERDQLESVVRAAIGRIQGAGCIIKDLDIGLVDFPSRLNGEEILLCWQLGEDRIRFWHRPDEGFAGRKPIDPNDAGAKDLIQ
ncbi:MAG: DUF2203 domain-containing protein [Candidatus Acidiferrales bacterium]